MKRVSRRFTTKAGESFTITMVFLSSLPMATAVAVVASSVDSVRAISRSGITATGLKKWKPITRSGFFKPSDIFVTDKDEVFVARMHSGETIDSSSVKSFCLSGSSSKIASIMKSHPAYAFLSVDPEIKPESRAAPSGERRRFSTSFCISAPIYARPLSTRS